MYVYSYATSHNRGHSAGTFLHHQSPKGTSRAQPQTDLCPALYLLVLPGRLLLLLPQIPTTFEHGNKSPAGNRSLEVGKKIAGSICKYLEMACVQAKPLGT